MRLRMWPWALVALTALPLSAFAHRLDEYLQATLVDIEPARIRLEMNLTAGVEVAEKVLAQIDRDGDGVISAKEGAAYAELLMGDLNARLDGRDVALKVTASDFPEPSEIRAGLGIIQVEFTAAPEALAAGAHTLTVQNRHLHKESVYLFNAAKPKEGSVQITTQKRNWNQSSGEIAFSVGL